MRRKLRKSDSASRPGSAREKKPQKHSLTHTRTHTHTPTQQLQPVFASQGFRAEQRWGREKELSDGVERRSRPMQQSGGPVRCVVSCTEALSQTRPTPARVPCQKNTSNREPLYRLKELFNSCLGRICEPLRILAVFRAKALLQEAIWGTSEFTRRTDRKASLLGLQPSSQARSFRAGACCLE